MLRKKIDGFVFYIIRILVSRQWMDMDNVAEPLAVFLEL
jgi:hypothetical protein